MSSRSRHSRRRLPTQRSARARAFGARTGALITRMPSERKTSSNSRVNVLSRSRTRTVSGHPRHRAASAGCAPAGSPTATSRELDEEQNVEALQEERVDGEEVAFENACRLRSQELGPAWLDPFRRRLDPRLLKDRPDRARRKLDPEPDQLALDPPVSPARVLPCKPAPPAPAHRAASPAGPAGDAGTSSGARPTPGASGKASLASRTTISSTPAGEELG
jgi:hypothetical protein